MSKPLADLIRPKNLDEIVGQEHILAKGRPLRRILESGHVPNMIFYGPPGTGKTTVARIIADKANMTMRKLNGTTTSTSEIKEIIAETHGISGMNGILLYLDEIQYLNKKQQQSLLEFIENGSITLIASTTENPFFSVFNAILSRCTIFEFKSVEPEDVKPAVVRAFSIMSENLGIEIEYSQDVLDIIAYGCGGDVRKSINAVELCVYSADEKDGKLEILTNSAKMLCQKSNMRYDRGGDQHYDLLSALQKSIRGSDENAALYYIARLLEAGDLISICRRMLVIASEDIGLAYPMAAVITKACCDNALQLGVPEAEIPLAEAAIMLCTAPKSNSANKAIKAANSDLKKYGALEIPRRLQNVHADGKGNSEFGQHYLFPHDYPNHWVAQQYLPDAIKNHVYYEFGNNKTEQAALDYRKKVRGEE